MGVLKEVGQSAGSFLDSVFSLKRFERAGERVGHTGDALVGGMLALTALGLGLAARAVPAAFRRGAEAVGRLKAADLIALGVGAATVALLIRTKVWQLLTAGGLLVLAGILRRLRESEQERVVEVLTSMDESQRQAFVDAANRGDADRARELLAHAT
jgi:hypothetical protein